MEISYYFFVIVSISLFIIGLKDPKHFATCLFFSFLNIPNYSPYFITLLLSFLSFILLLKYNIKHQYFKYYVLYSLSIFLYILIINSFALNRNLPINDLFVTLGKFFQAFFLVGTLLALIHSRGLTKILKIIRNVYVISILLGIIQLFTLSYFFYFDYPFYARFSFLAIPDSNYSGMYLILFFCLLSTLFRYNELNLFSIISFIIGFLAIILTLSRTTYIVFVIILLMHIFSLIYSRVSSNSAKNVKIIFITILLSSLSTLLWYSFLHDSLWPHMNRFLQYVSEFNTQRLTGQINTFRLRTDIWYAVLQNISKIDIFLGRGDVYIPDWNYDVTGHYLTIHNLPLMLLVKYGIFAPLLYVAFIINIFIKNFDISTELKYFLFILTLSYFVFSLAVSDEIGIFIIMLIGITSLQKNWLDLNKN
jgi:O-antigen ligase